MFQKFQKLSFCNVANRFCFVFKGGKLSLNRKMSGEYNLYPVAYPEIFRGGA